MGPTPLDTALTFIPVFSGFLSIVGATAILYNILSDHQRRFTSPYFRIMFGLSVADLIFGLVSMTSTFFSPKEKSHRYFARGNEASCKAMAFIKHAFGFPQPIYIASLSIYYLFVIRYDMKDVVFRKKFEHWLHVIAYGYPLLGSIVSLSLDLFVSLPQGCRIKYSAKVYRWVFTNAVVIVSLSIIVICMVSIALYVRKRERIMNRRFSFANSEISRSRGLVKQYKAVMSQAILYISCFILAWICPGVNAFIRAKSPVSLILVAIFWPLQGFFNSIVYFWPRFTKTREEHRDKSCCWIIKDMVLTSTVSKEQRRVQDRAQRRRSSLMKSDPSSPSTTNVAVAHSPLSISPVLHQSASPSRLQQSSPVIDNAHTQTAIAAMDDVATDVEMTQTDSDIVISGSFPANSIEYEPLIRLRAELLAEHLWNDIDSGNPGNNNRNCGSMAAAALEVHAMYGTDDSSTNSIHENAAEDDFTDTLTIHESSTSDASELFGMRHAKASVGVTWR